ncbi:MAG: hypothetical protein CMJ85_11580 [Planctomycetes bacterium]|nr:hypothetical protein [Planctomycetota bacterium]
MWLITAGPTREHLDDVRFFSNASSGRMGFALASAAAQRGRDVTVVSGPVDLPDPDGIEVLRVVSGQEMLDACRLLLEERPVEVVIAAAAVCDHRPRQRADGKPAKGEGVRTLELVENPDVIASLAALGVARTHVGFALESLKDRAAALQRARSKLTRKGLDAIVLNGIEAMESSRSHAMWITASGEPVDLGDLDKPALAAALVERVSALQS